MTQRRLRILGCSWGVLAGLVLPTAVTADLRFNDFRSTSGLVTLGDAARAGTSLRLTPSSQIQQGAVWFVDRQRVADGFDTIFVFRISSPGGLDDADGNPGGDGFAFVIQNEGLNAFGASPGDHYQGITQSVAVEIDTWRNEAPLSPDLNDPDGNHVSIHTAGRGPNGMHESFSIGRVSNVSPPLDNSEERTLRIAYIPGRFMVYLDDLRNPIIDIAIDLTAELDLTSGGAYVGLTAGTGAAIEQHDILSWSFRSGAPTDCLDIGSTICLGAGRFQVEVDWADTRGGTGEGIPLPFRSNDSALLYFFNSDNWEMLIKVLDGCAINDRFWVFFAATTDVAFDLQVIDTANGAEMRYSNTLGQPADAITDTGAFATCP